MTFLSMFTKRLYVSSQTQRNILRNLSSLKRRRLIHHLMLEGSMFTKTCLERAPSAASVLSDKIDSAWTGTDRSPKKGQLNIILQRNGSDVAPFRQLSQLDYPPFARLESPARVNSFDSALRLQERIRRKGLLPSSMHLTAIKSFHASGDYRNMIRDPVSCVQRSYSQMSPNKAQKFNPLMSSSPSFISYASLVHDGARFMVPHNGYNDIVIAVYDSDPTSIISYALCSKEYKDRVTDKLNVPERSWYTIGIKKEHGMASSVSAWQSFSSLDDYVLYGSYGSEDVSSTINPPLADSKTSPHLRISFEDESSNAGGKAKFSVTCYFAKQFDALRKSYCSDELDFIRSLSRCKRWSAQGGKSNVYFAKSLDERFIVKQVQKTELGSFDECGPEYFKYLTDSASSQSPSCLAKVLGLYQASVKHLKGGRETNVDLIVMENLYFGRTIARVYDLKGSLRSRYNADKNGANKVLLDMNLLETLRTKPIFLGSKAKRILERAVWNDTSFLALVDVMDYSLLVGVDEERKELVLGIIDFMRQYTWDKHLETWVKASGILGGSKECIPDHCFSETIQEKIQKSDDKLFPHGA